MSLPHSHAALSVATSVTRILPGVVPTTLVRNIDLDISDNEFIAITGPSGSGKSSLLSLLGMLDLPTTGEVRIRGRATAHMDEAERALTRLSTLGFVFQFHFLLPEFSALENVMLPMRALASLPEEGMRERARFLLDSLGLSGHVLKRPRSAVRRPAPAGGGGACTGQRPAADPRRRADGLARLGLERAGVPDPARSRRQGWQNRGGGHARSRPCGQDRSPDPDRRWWNYCGRAARFGDTLNEGSRAFGASRPVLPSQSS